MSGDELIGRLRAGGCEPDARSLADALWLAQWTPPPNASDDETSRGAPTSAAGGRSAGFAVPVPAVPAVPDGAARVAAAAGPDHGDLLTPTPVAPPRHVPPRSIPAADSLPGLWELQRALSPLRRHRSTRGRP